MIEFIFRTWGAVLFFFIAWQLFNIYDREQLFGRWIYAPTKILIALIAAPLLALLWAFVLFGR